MSTATQHAPETPTEPTTATSGLGLLAYLFLGIVFGILLTRSEVVSWFRIQEMFRFQSIHMYGILGSAVAVALGSLQLLKRSRWTAADGSPIEVPPKKWGRVGTRYWGGGLLFGLGWALLGACPGPIFALIGAGIPVYGVALLSALAGTWAYGALRPHLPHY